MSKNTAYLFFFPATVYGGHEAMALRIMQTARTVGFDTIAVCIRENRMLLNELSRADFPVFTFPGRLIGGQNLGWMIPPAINPAVRALKRIVPVLMRADVVVGVCGDIEIGAAAMHLFQRLQLRFVCYLPMAHTKKRMGARLAVIRDFLDRFCYSVPHAFVTITDHIRNQINARTNVPVFVLENYIGENNAYKKPAATIGTASEELTIGVVGRISFKQKGQDWLVRAIMKHRAELHERPIRVLFFGAGPDVEKLQRMCRANSQFSNLSFEYKGYSSLEVMFESIDIVLVPSWFEGEPLIVSEAINSKMPILCRDIPELTRLVGQQNSFKTASDLVDLLSGAQRYGPVRHVVSGTLPRTLRDFEHQAVSVLRSIRHEGSHDR